MAKRRGKGEERGEGKNQEKNRRKQENGGKIFETFLNGVIDMRYLEKNFILICWALQFYFTYFGFYILPCSQQTWQPSRVIAEVRVGAGGRSAHGAGVLVSANPGANLSMYNQKTITSQFHEGIDSSAIIPVLSYTNRLQIKCISLITPPLLSEAAAANQLKTTM